MIDNTLTIYCNCDVVIITIANAISTELASNIIARNRKDMYGKDDKDYKAWYDISECAYNLWKYNTTSKVEVEPNIFKMFPLKDWKSYTKYIK
jgi:hypothetical protein